MTDGLASLVRACAEGPPEAQYEAASDACATAIGHDLFTVMRFNAETWEVERLYSTRPERYPPGGRKAKRETPWGHRVLGKGTPFMGAGEDAIRWAFGDADTILAMGLQHVINMPVRAGGRTLGTVNLLRRAPAFTQTDAAHLRLVAGLLAAEFIFRENLPKDTVASS